MADERNQNPTTGSESDISKSQSQQQPNQANQQSGERGQQQGQFETGQQGNEALTGDQAATGQAQSGSPDAGMQGDTLTRQRADVEGSSLGSQESGEGGSGFVGSQGQRDRSSELIDEEDEDFSRDGQGAPEGK